MQSFILCHKPQLTIISGALIAAGLVARFALHSQSALTISGTIGICAHSSKSCTSLGEM